MFDFMEKAKKVETALKIRRLLRKEDLCHVFGMVSPSGKTIYYSKLRKRVMTDTVLSELEITVDRYEEIKGGKLFNWEETQRIINYFSIDPAELP